MTPPPTKKPGLDAEVQEVDSDLSSPGPDDSNHSDSTFVDPILYGHGGTSLVVAEEDLNDLQETAERRSAWCDLNRDLQRQSQNDPQVRSTMIGLIQPYAPCTMPWRELTTVNLKDLVIESHHPEKCLFFKVVSPVIRRPGLSWAFVEDKTGEIERLEVRLHTSRNGEDFLCSAKSTGSWCIIKQPYLTTAWEYREQTLRIDHPSDLILNCTPAGETKTTPESRFKAGNAAHDKRAWLVAHTEYSAGLELLGLEHPEEISPTIEGFGASNESTELPKPRGKKMTSTQRQRAARARRKAMAMAGNSVELPAVDNEKPVGNEEPAESEELVEAEKLLEEPAASIAENIPPSDSSEDVQPLPDKIKPAGVPGFAFLQGKDTPIHCNLEEYESLSGINEPSSRPMEYLGYWLSTADFEATYPAEYATIMSQIVKAEQLAKDEELARELQRQDELTANADSQGDSESAEGWQDLQPRKASKLVTAKEDDTEERSSVAPKAAQSDSNPFKLLSPTQGEASEESGEEDSSDEDPINNEIMAQKGPRQTASTEKPTKATPSGGQTAKDKAKGKAAKDKLRRDLFRSRALTNLLLGRYDEAILDATSALSEVDSSQKVDRDANLYLGHASYALKDFKMAQEYFNRAKKGSPADERVKYQLERCAARLRASKRNSVELTLTRPPRNDCADSLQHTYIAESPGKGLGLFSSIKFNTHDIIMAEKAFCAVWGDEEEALHSYTHDARDNIIRSSPAGLIAATVRSLLNNPSQIPKVMELSGQWRGGQDGSSVSLYKNEDGPIVDVFRVHDIITRNALPVDPNWRHNWRNDRPLAPFRISPVEPATTGAYKDAGLWIHASRLNHSCTPNACMDVYGDYLVVRALEPVQANEEVLIKEI